MLTKIKRQTCLDAYKSFPTRTFDSKEDEEIYFYPKVFKSYVLTLPSKSFKGHVRALGIELARLAKALNTGTLIFLGDIEIPWLYQNNDYKPAKEAQQYLTDNKIGKRFNGALEVDHSELPTFIRHLAWLVRCNAVLPYIHFMDHDQSILGSICQYGNLHLDTLNEQTDTLLKAFIGTSRFQFGNLSNCTNFVSNTSKIKGRQIQL